VKETLKEAVEDWKKFCFYNEMSDGIPLNESGRKYYRKKYKTAERVNLYALLDRLLMEIMGGRKNSIDSVCSSPKIRTRVVLAMMLFPQIWWKNG
jgi:hypothetical protein